jgi:hypothetical protein
VEDLLPAAVLKMDANAQELVVESPIAEVARIVLHKRL